MRRDIRRFLIYRFRMLEVRNSVPVNLVRVWHTRFGVLPPFDQGAVSGSSFVLRDGERGVVFSRPERAKVEDSARAQVFMLLAAKHGVEVRLARGEETPNLGVRERLPQQRDLDAIEEWPVPAEYDGPVIAEYVGGVGVFLCDGFDCWATANQLDDAMTFANADEAQTFLSLHAPQHRVTLRFVSAARAEQDQREAALFND
jgi:hypothetical protein